MENQYIVTIPEEELQRLAAAVKAINPHGPEPVLDKRLRNGAQPVQHAAVLRQRHPSRQPGLHAVGTTPPRHPDAPSQPPQPVHEKSFPQHHRRLQNTRATRTRTHRPVLLNRRHQGQPDKSVLAPGTARVDQKHRRPRNLRRRHHDHGQIQGTHPHGKHPALHRQDMVPHRRTRCIRAPRRDQSRMADSGRMEETSPARSGNPSLSKSCRPPVSKISSTYPPCTSTTNGTSIPPSSAKTSQKNRYGKRSCAAPTKPT